MRLTLLRAKEALKHRCPASLLEYRLNRVVERYLTHGKYVGSIQRLAIQAPYGMLALPRQYRTIEGVKVNGVTKEMGNEWYEFIPGKSDDIGYTLDAVRDLGDGWAIMRTPRVTPPLVPDPTSTDQDIPNGGTIAISFPGADNPNIKVLIEGRDTNFMPVSLTFSGQQTLANVFTRISRIHTEQTPFNITITFTTDDNISTVLAIVEPLEEETYYRRYILDNWITQPMIRVDALCKRRHIEFTSDNDILPLTNLYALEKGLDALQYESENDITLANQYWGQGIDALNDELKDTNMDPGWPNIRFMYPGRTKPRWTSHY